MPPPSPRRRPASSRAEEDADRCRTRAHRAEEESKAKAARAERTEQAERAAAAGRGQRTAGRGRCQSRIRPCHCLRAAGPSAPRPMPKPQAEQQMLVGQNAVLAAQEAVKTAQAREAERRWRRRHGKPQRKSKPHCSRPRGARRGRAARSIQRCCRQPVCGEKQADWSMPFEAAAAAAKADVHWAKEAAATQTKLAAEAEESCAGGSPKPPG